MAQNGSLSGQHSFRFTPDCWSSSLSRRLTIVAGDLIRCCECCWMSDLLINGLPHFVVSIALVFVSARQSRRVFKSSLICFVQILLGAVHWILHWTGCCHQSSQCGRWPASIRQTWPNQRILHCWICVPMVGCSWHRSRMVSNPKDWFVQVLFTNGLSFRPVQEDGYN